MPKSQKKRTPKTSNGINAGGGKMDRPFTEVEKILLGGGLLKGLPKRWKA